LIASRPTEEFREERLTPDLVTLVPYAEWEEQVL
jgi:hypothetical protein